MKIDFDQIDSILSELVVMGVLFCILYFMVWIY